INISSLDKDTYVVALDVCHVSASAISTNSDVPIIDEYQNKMFSFEFMGFLDVLKLHFYPVILSCQLDRPPRSYQ
ncbi:MAG TPA: hypothetical protein VN328_12335, partial [Thermodesulfovibrionales bacterium]|nr:hypothetical protein [Thermodesulfovibrionales bacterium]